MKRVEEVADDPTHEMEQWVDRHCGPHVDAYVGYLAVQNDVLATCLREHWPAEADQVVQNDTASQARHAGKYAVAVEVVNS